MASPGLSFAVEPAETQFLVRLVGSADFSQTGTLQRCFQEIPRRAHPPVLLECSELTFLSSSALGAIVFLRQQLVAVGGQLTLIGLQPTVRDVLRVTGLLDKLTVQPDREQALASQSELPKK